MNFLQNVGLKGTLVICSYLACFLFGWWCCSQRYISQINQYKLNAEKLKSELLQHTSIIEQETRAKIAQIERESLDAQIKLKEEYENTISNLRSEYDLNNSVQCDNSRSAASVSSETSNTRNLRCYTDADIYQKIERSLAIAKECDELATKYNSLLRVCKVE